MAKARDIVHVLVGEGSKARANFQVWWALRNVALPKYYATMNDSSHVDFFHAANSGHYTLFFLLLAKIFDRDPCVAGLAELKRQLRSEGSASIAIRIGRELRPFEKQIRHLGHP